MRLKQACWDSAVLRWRKNRQNSSAGKPEKTNITLPKKVKVLLALIIEEATNQWVHSGKDRGIPLETGRREARRAALGNQWQI